MNQLKPMKRMKCIRTFIAFLCLGVGCQSPRGKLRTLDLSDGVSQSEAMIIGRSYFKQHLRHGKFTSIEDGGDHWRAVGKLRGYLAKPLGFTIDKRSGKITSQGGPGFDSPLDIYR